MSLENGYIPAWRCDDVFFDDTAEYAIFHYLLKQAHYKPTPYITPIEGSIRKGNKLEPYSKKWSISFGEVFTSKTKISKKLNMTRETVQKKLLNMEKKGLLAILLTEPALVIKIHNYKYFTIIPKNEEERLDHYLAPFCLISEKEGVTDLSQGGDGFKSHSNNHSNNGFNNQSNNQPDPPLPPQGEEIGGGDLDNIISIDRGSKEPPPQKRTIISPVRPKQKPMGTYRQPLTIEEIEAWRFKSNVDDKDLETFIGDAF